MSNFKNGTDSTGGNLYATYSPHNALSHDESILENTHVELYINNTEVYFKSKHLQHFSFPTHYAVNWLLA
jgi:hypothetical protein